MNCSTFGKICLAATVPLCLTASIAHAANIETLTIKKQTSHYMNLGQTIARIAVGNPDIASVVQLPGSASEFLIVTKKTEGSTSLFVWTADGTRHEYLVIVSPEDPGLAMLIEKAINLPDVHVKIVDDRILLTGTVENQYEKNYVLQTARLFINGNTESNILVGSGYDMKLDVQESKSTNSSEDVEASKSKAEGKIIDLIQILHPTQIRLEAQIIEINSEDAKSIGLQYSTSGNSPGIFSFGENYARTNTQISENSSLDRSSSLGGNANLSGTASYDGSGSYENNPYSYSLDGSANLNGSLNRNSSFNRTVTSTWYDMVQFANNPLKWVGQHFAPINVTLNALVTKGKARILSRPSVMTLSGEQATIQIGGRIPYSTSSAYGTNIELVDIGIILQFKPIVDSQNRIMSVIHTEVSNLNGETSTGQPIIATRRADSVMNLNSGAPVVIGGLMDSSETKNVSKIPLLGDIPIIGEFFKYTSKSRDKRELIIVVTPYLVGAEEELSQSPMSAAMRQWYEQEQIYVDAMENFDFKTNQPVLDEQDTEEEDSQRILPPPNYSKGKTTDRPFNN